MRGCARGKPGAVEDRVACSFALDNGAVGTATWDFTATDNEDTLELRGTGGVLVVPHLKNGDTIVLRRAGGEADKEEKTMEQFDEIRKLCGGENNFNITATERKLRMFVKNLCVGDPGDEVGIWTCLILDVTHSFPGGFRRWSNPYRSAQNSDRPPRYRKEPSKCDNHWRTQVHVDNPLLSCTI